MKKLLLKNPQFITSAIDAKGYPTLRTSSGKLMDEIAVAGRSNVGKSTLINNLFRVRGLAKTSATPGKTQLLNFFTVDDEWSFVDLPGYGYAKVPKNLQISWAKMVQTYLETRSSLKLLLFLFDIRRTPTDEDRMLMEWINYANKKVILVLTKVDQVTKSAVKARVDEIVKELGAAELPCVLYSSTKNMGRDDLIYAIGKAL